tara:strand:- start:179853 stop:180392 length:540 start_codon:yes stop_codon:yes gene_type:complete
MSDMENALYAVITNHTEFSPVVYKNKKFFCDGEMIGELKLIDAHDETVYVLNDPLFLGKNNKSTCTTILAKSDTYACLIYLYLVRTNRIELKVDNADQRVMIINKIDIQNLNSRRNIIINGTLRATIIEHAGYSETSNKVRPITIKGTPLWLLDWKLSDGGYMTRLNDSVLELYLKCIK